MKNSLKLGEKIFLYIAVFVVLYAIATVACVTAIFSSKLQAEIKTATEPNADLFVDDSEYCLVEIRTRLYEEGEYVGDETSSYEYKMSPDDCVRMLTEQYNAGVEEYNERTGQNEVRVTVSIPSQDEVEKNHYYIWVDILW